MSNDLIWEILYEILLLWDALNILEFNNNNINLLTILIVSQWSKYQKLSLKKKYILTNKILLAICIP